MMTTDNSTAAGAAEFDPFGRTVREVDGRQIRLTIRRPPGDTRDALTVFYDRFGTPGRAQGIPQPPARGVLSG